MVQKLRHVYFYTNAESLGLLQWICDCMNLQESYSILHKTKAEQKTESKKEKKRRVGEKEGKKKWIKLPFT